MGKEKIFEQGLDRSTANFTPLSPLSFIGRAAAVYPEHVSVIHGPKRFPSAPTHARCRPLGHRRVWLAEANRTRQGLLGRRP